MQNTSSTPSTPVTTLENQELTAFQQCKNFNLFLFSKTGANVPVFLLHKTSKSSEFSHFHGEFSRQDPNTYLAIAREFLSQTSGLLHSNNFKHFLAESADPAQETDIVFEKNNFKQYRIQRGFTPALLDILKLLSESPYIHQDYAGNVSYFVEVPMLSLEAIRQVAEKKELDFEPRYFTFEEILDDDNEEIAQSLRSCLTSNQKLRQYAQRYIVQNETIEIKENYAIICCCTFQKTEMMSALHYSIHKKHGENWRFYKAYEGELPTDEELKNLKGVIIPGSAASAYSDLPWFKDLFVCIRKIVYTYKHINLLCICFGSQIVAAALGGKTAKMDKPFIRGGETLTVESSFYELEYVRALGLQRKRNLVIGEAHGDHIVSLPRRAVLHASSTGADIEIYTVGNNVLAFQGHPEFSESWTAGTNYRVNNLSIEDYDSYAEKCMKEKFPSPLTQDEILKVCYKFLKKDTVQASN